MKLAALCRDSAAIGDPRENGSTQLAVDTSFSSMRKSLCPSVCSNASIGKRLPLPCFTYCCTDKNLTQRLPVVITEALPIKFPNTTGRRCREVCVDVKYMMRENHDCDII